MKYLVKKIVLVFLCLMLVSACEESQQSGLDGEDIGIIKFYYESGRFFDVLVEADTLSGGTLSNPELRFIIGKTYLNIGHPDQAYEVLYKLSQEQHSVSDMDLWIVESLLKQRKIEEAKALLLSEGVATQYSKHPKYLLLNGQIALSESSVENAKTIFSQIIEESEEYGLAQVWLAKIDLAQNRVSKARERLENILKDRKKLADAWLLLANIKFNNEQYIDAENFYLQALKLDNSKILTQQSLQVAQNVVRCKVALGNISSSKIFYESFLESYPKSPIYHFELARLAYSSNDLPLAEKHLTDVLKKSGDNPRVIILLAKVLFNQEKLTEADNLLTSHISNGVSDLELVLMKAIIDIELGNNDQAIQLLGRYIDDEENNKIALKPLLAHIHVSNNDELQFKKTLSSYDIEDPVHLRSIGILTNVFLEIGENEQALNLLGSLIEFYPYSTNIKILYLSVLSEAGSKKMISESIRKWIIAQPDNYTLRLAVTNQYIVEQNYVEAISELTSLDGKNLSPPEEIHLSNNLKNLVISTKGTRYSDDVLSLAKSLQKSFSALPQLELMLADLYISESNFEQAVPHYESILESFPNNFAVLNNLAWSYFKINDDRAIEFAKRAYVINPNDAPVCDTYGWILANNGQLKRGLVLIERALEIDPGNDAIRNHLIEIQSKLN